jgi:hypothetical protein
MKTDFRSTDSSTNVAVLNSFNQWELLGTPEQDYDTNLTHSDRKTLVADSTESHDGFEIWWLHIGDASYTPEPSEMFSDEYAYMNEVERCLKDKRDLSKNPINKVVNYTISISDFKDIIEKANFDLRINPIPAEYR